MGNRRKQLCQFQPKFLRFKHTAGQPEIMVLPGKLNGIFAIFLLFRHEHAAQGRLVAEHQVPVDPVSHLFNGVSGVSNGVQPANDGAHAGSGDIIYFKSCRVDRLEYTYMRQSLCSSAA
jgi:hypothetical protein